MDFRLVGLRLIGLVVVVPVMEELFWRSFLMRWLTNSMFLSIEPRQVSRSAFVITAVLFALAHDLWLAGLLAGQGTKVILIESVERLLEKETRDAFTDLLALVRDDPARAERVLDGSTDACCSALDRIAA